MFTVNSVLASQLILDENKPNHVECLFQKGIKPHCQKGIPHGHAAIRYTYAYHIMHTIYNIVMWPYGIPMHAI